MVFERILDNMNGILVATERQHRRLWYSGRNTLRDHKCMSDALQEEFERLEDLMGLLFENHRAVLKLDPGSILWVDPAVHLDGIIDVR